MNPRRHRRRSKLLQQVLRLHPKECGNCGATGNLQLDHITPISAGGADNIANAQLLCSSCHRAKTNTERRRRMMRVTPCGRVISATYPTVAPKIKPAGSRSRFSGRESGW